MRLLSPPPPMSPHVIHHRASLVWQQKYIGANLVYKKAISLMDALLGFERMLTLLDGRRVPVVHDQVGA